MGQPGLGAAAGARSRSPPPAAAAAAAGGAPPPPPPPPRVSRRIASTDTPVIVATKRLVAAREGCLSLAQGVVHWAPPPEALAAAAAAAADPASHAYGPDEGAFALRAALRAKLAAENGLAGVDVVVTAGANQAFASAVLALVDAGDEVVLFRPYYFNHLMAVQMAGGGGSVAFGPCDPATCLPDLDWLEARLAGGGGAPPPRMVVLVNPCNPTGVLLPPEHVARAAAACAAAGAWLVLDNTYEHFVHGGGEGGGGEGGPGGGGRRHACVAAPHVLNIFSFSKAYGLMGWRVGYIAYDAGSPELAAALLKVQDTVPICAAQASQAAALGAVAAGRPWVAARVAGLAANRAAILGALAPLGVPGGGVWGGDAIYWWARLPAGCEDDRAVVEWLVRAHGVCLIPGSACGAPGHVRAAFANLEGAACAEAARRLRAGLEELAARGMAAVRGP